MNIEDFFSKFRKRIEFNYSKQKLLFDVSPSLFSSADVDRGTFQLIDSLRKNKEIDYRRILDVGCGYGPIGIFLKKANPDSEVYCADRDYLALEFTRHNARLNDCEVKAYSGLDYQNVGGKFSLICCNYPAKVGINALKKFVYGASKHLDRAGIFVIVIVKELLNDFESILREGIEVLYNQKSSGHFVFHLKYKSNIDFDGDSYFRNDVKYKLGNKNYFLKTAFSISEFESQSYVSDVIVEVLKKVDDMLSVFVINSFQGHLPIAVSHYLKPKKLVVISRDLLSLEYSKNNLIRNGFSNADFCHKMVPDNEKGDLLVWRLEEDIEISQFKKEFEKMKKNFKEIIIGASKSKLNRLIGLMRIKSAIEEEKGTAKAICLRLL